MSHSSLSASFPCRLVMQVSTAHITKVFMTDAECSFVKSYPFSILNKCSPLCVYMKEFWISIEFYVFFPTQVPQWL